MTKWALLIISLVVGFAIWVRIAPSDPTRWHRDPFSATDPGMSGVLVMQDMLEKPSQVFVNIDEIIRSTPRTTVLAGSVDDGRITYVSRSFYWGFPDYITIAIRPTDGGSQLAFLSRLRFGRSDLGVNGRRVGQWLQALKTQTQ